MVKELYRQSLKQHSGSADEKDKLTLFKESFNTIVEQLREELVVVCPDGQWRDTTSRYCIFHCVLCV